MTLVQNVPAFSIILAMLTAIVTSVLKGPMARRASILMTSLLTAGSVWVLAFAISYGESWVYYMGHFSAPWGNEIRIGMLEAVLALLFCLITLAAILGGADSREELAASKQSLFYIMVDLLLAGNLALVYTNDIFTAYVFVEICTLAACGVILGKWSDLTIPAAVRYMIMSLMGSGLFLLGICFTYDVTGHLLLSNIKEAILELAGTGSYEVPLIMTIGLMTVGLAIKSALWPFHAWVNNAYAHSHVTSQAMLSSIVSKGYIILLIKLIFRATSLEVFSASKMVNVIFIFGIIGMMVGSIDAIRKTDIRKMIACSSVAQIGYIYMGLGLGTEAGAAASVYHILAHSAAKSLVFIAAAGLIKSASGRVKLRELSGAGHCNRVAGVGFVVGALSMIGIPGLGGFVSKILLALASLASTSHAVLALTALVASTVLNAIYFMRAIIWIYTPHGKESAMGEESLTVDEAAVTTAPVSNSWQYNAAIIGLIIMNLALGILAGPINTVIQNGLAIFG